MLVALAATLPRQIETDQQTCISSPSGWNELLASWTRLGGVAHSMHPEFDPAFDSRIKFDRLVLREGDRASTVTSLDEAMRFVLAQPHGRVNVRGAERRGQIHAAHEPEGADQDPRLLLADRRPPRLPVHARQRAGR